MTSDKFKADFRAFLESSTVNLGRKTAKTRQIFIDAAMAKFDAFFGAPLKGGPVVKKEQMVNSTDDRILCIKPKDSRKALNVGKGVHAMTASESMRADEQLGRSPYGTQTTKKEKSNE